MKYLNEYISGLLAEGKYHFTKDNAMAALELAQSQFQLQAQKLIAKGDIVHLISGFYIITSGKYSCYDCNCNCALDCQCNSERLPPQWIIDPLMKYLGQDYYVGLLSAASIYGASYQTQSSFQVITTKATRDIAFGKGKIEFHCYKHCIDAIKIKTLTTAPTEYFNISGKEQTLVDLLRFNSADSHINNISTIVKDLAPKCSPHSLQQLAKNERANSVLQRLGFILEFIGFSRLASIVDKELSCRKLQHIALNPHLNDKTGKIIPRWKLIMNDSLKL